MKTRGWIMIRLPEPEMIFMDGSREVRLWTDKHGIRHDLNNWKYMIGKRLYAAGRERLTGRLRLKVRPEDTEIAYAAPAEFLEWVE